MTKQLNLTRLAVILLFTVTFTLIGAYAPVVYATTVPADNVIEVHSFDAQDTTTNSDAHYVCFDRTVNHGASVLLFTELYLLNDNGNRVEIDSQRIYRYFQQGRQKVVTPMSLPERLQEGTYRYVVVAKMNMADGRVIREFSSQSTKFNITDGPPIDPEPTSCQ